MVTNLVWCAKLLMSNLEGAIDMTRSEIDELEE